MDERPDEQPAGDIEMDDASTEQSADAPRHGDRWSGRVPTRSLRALGTVAAVVLALLVLLSSNAVLQTGARQLAFGWLPTPVPTLGPDDQWFYLLPNVPWGTVLLDGHPLNRVPLAGSGHPLHLARGRHEFEWRAAPFGPLHCSVWVPAEYRDGCWTTDPAQSASLTPLATAGAWIIPVNESLATLPPEQHAMLVSAAQTALAASVYRATVRPGELYALTTPTSTAQPAAARQALVATLSFHLLADFGIREPCSGSNIRIDPCRFPGQDCSEFCTLNVAPTPGAPWKVAAMAWLSWDYTTPQGREVARGQGDPGLNFRLVELSIAWTAEGWQVTPLFGHQPGVPSADDAVCAAARVWLARGPLAGLLPAGNELTELDYFSGSAPTDGCAVVVAPHQAAPLGNASADSDAPRPLFLVRFGVLLAANSAAHSLWPALPRADANDSAIALGLVGLTTVAR